MGKLSEEQAKTLKELQALADAPDGDEDFEVEIGSGEHFGRVPYSKARKFFQDKFGIDLDPEPDPEPEEGKGKKDAKAKDGGGEVRPVRFGRRVS